MFMEGGVFSASGRITVDVFPFDVEGSAAQASATTTATCDSVASKSNSMRDPSRAGGLPSEACRRENVPFFRFERGSFVPVHGVHHPHTPWFTSIGYVHHPHRSTVVSPRISERARSVRMGGRETSFRKSSPGVPMLSCRFRKSCRPHPELAETPNRTENRGDLLGRKNHYDFGRNSVDTQPATQSLGRARTAARQQHQHWEKASTNIHQ